MTSPHLRDRANLEQLKKQAKSLLAAARSQEPHAIARFEAVLIGRSLRPDVIAYTTRNLYWRVSMGLRRGLN